MNNKDKLALLLAIVIQFGAIVWWASRLSSETQQLSQDTRRHLEEIIHNQEKIMDRISLLEQRVHINTGKIEELSISVHKNDK